MILAPRRGHFVQRRQVFQHHPIALLILRLLVQKDLRLIVPILSCAPAAAAAAAAVLFPVPSMFASGGPAGRGAPREGVMPASAAAGFGTSAGYVHHGGGALVGGARGGVRLHAQGGELVGRVGFGKAQSAYSGTDAAGILLLLLLLLLVLVTVAVAGAVAAADAALAAVAIVAIVAIVVVDGGLVAVMTWRQCGFAASGCRRLAVGLRVVSVRVA